MLDQDNRFVRRLIAQPIFFGERQPPEEIEQFISDSESRGEAFWDRWPEGDTARFTRCDYRLVWEVLDQLTEQGKVHGAEPGKQLSLCEWGCGFGVVAGIARMLGWDSVGIEAERDLVVAARDHLKAWNLEVPIWHANCLPARFPTPANYPRLPADLPPAAYERHGRPLESFSTVFVYPWPGLAGYFKQVFATLAAPAAQLIVFLGPYELELYRLDEQPDGTESSPL
jgi:hypothetical protein